MRAIHQDNRIHCTPSTSVILVVINARRLLEKLSLDTDERRLSRHSVEHITQLHFLQP